MTLNKLCLSGVLLTFGMNVYAGQIDGSAVLGSMLGAGAGSAVGSSIGGREGAIIGGGAGGAAIGSSRGTTQTQTRIVSEERVVYVDDHHDNCRHRGHYKRNHGHHDRD